MSRLRRTFGFGGVVALLLLILGTTPASAVQTTTFGLVATPGVNGASRSALVHLASSSSIDDDVIVYNRTAKPLTVNLQALGMTKSATKNFTFLPIGKGLGSQIHLATSSVTLPAHSQAKVPVEISPGAAILHATYGAVTATLASTQTQPLAVQQRLAVVIELQPNGLAAVRPSGAPSWPWWLLLILLVLVIAWLVHRYRDRNRTLAAQIHTPRAPLGRHPKTVPTPSPQPKTPAISPGTRPKQRPQRVNQPRPKMSVPKRPPKG